MSIESSRIPHRRGPHHFRSAVPPPNARPPSDDTAHRVGWIDGSAIGFRGYDSEDEAMRAARVAHRTMVRRFAGTSHKRKVKELERGAAQEPLMVDRAGDVELILAGHHPIARLVRPGEEPDDGSDSFGFEVQLPVPVDDRSARSTAAVLYATLQHSDADAGKPDRSAAAPDPAWELGARQREAAAAGYRPLAWRWSGPVDDAGGGTAGRVGLTAVLVIYVMLGAMILPAITIANVFYVLMGAALLALVTLAGRARPIAPRIGERSRGEVMGSTPLRPVKSAPSRRLGVYGGLAAGWFPG